jgi:hypothetical protein
MIARPKRAAPIILKKVDLISKLFFVAVIIFFSFTVTPDSLIFPSCSGWSPDLRF